MSQSKFMREARVTIGQADCTLETGASGATAQSSCSTGLGTRARLAIRIKTRITPSFYSINPLVKLYFTSILHGFIQDTLFCLIGF